MATDERAAVLEASDLDSVLNGILDEERSSEGHLEGGDVLSVTMLNRPAPTPTTHGTLSDLCVIQDGSATLVAGSSPADPRPPSRPGDRQAGAIRGGTEEIVGGGDVVFSPPAWSPGSGIRTIHSRSHTRTPASP